MEYSKPLRNGSISSTESSINKYFNLICIQVGVIMRRVYSSKKIVSDILSSKFKINSSLAITN